jgi:predicted permease
VSLSELLQDARHGGRLFLKNRVMTCVAVISLGLAIGATSAVYSTVDWLLYRPTSGVVEPDRLITLTAVDRSIPESTFTFTFPQYLALKRLQDVFVEIATYGKVLGTVSDDQRADQVVLEHVSDDYFDVLGVRPVLGRTLSADDDVDGGPAVAMLAFGYWQSRFGGDLEIVGKRIRLNGRETQIVGVGPRDFDGYNLDWNGPTDIWVPIHVFPPFGRRSSLEAGIFYPIIGRLRPGLTQAAVEERAERWIAELPTGRSVGANIVINGIVVQPSSELRIARRQRAKAFLGVLLAVCVLILAAACLNIANFLTGHAVARRKEIAVRVALGARRMRVIQQLLVEALLIGLGGALLGVLLSVWIARVLAVMPRLYLNLPLSGAALTTMAAIDGRLLAVSVVLGVVCAIGFGLLPAILTAFRNPAEDLKRPRPQWTWCGTRLTWRQLLLVAQVSLTVTLAITAGLYARSFRQIAGVEPDYRDPAEVLVARIVPPPAPARPDDPFYRELLPRLMAMPEVESASMGWNPPLMIFRGPVGLPDGGVVAEAYLSGGGTRFFETHGIRLLTGREFEDSASDIKNSIIVNRALAQKLFGAQDPLGQAITMGLNERRVIVGVVAYDHCVGVSPDPTPCAWRPFTMTGPGYIRIRTTMPPMAFAGVLRRTVHQLSPDTAVAEEVSLDAWIANLMQVQRQSALASSGLATVGILLLAIGCGALFLSMVRESRREIAIRLALGCSHARLTGRILWQGALVMLAGLAVGAVAAWFVAHRIADQLYRTTPSDVPTFLAVPFVVGLAGLAAVSWAARIAVGTEPTEFLRSD